MGCSGFGRDSTFLSRASSLIKMSSEAQENSVKRVFRNPKNRQTKVHLIFDEKARKEYLTGFRKRKAERKKKYDEKMKKEMKKENAFKQSCGLKFKNLPPIAVSLKLNI